MAENMEANFWRRKKTRRGARRRGQTSGNLEKGEGSITIDDKRGLKKD